MYLLVTARKGITSMQLANPFVLACMREDLLGLRQVLCIAVWVWEFADFLAGLDLHWVLAAL